MNSNWSGYKLRHLTENWLKVCKHRAMINCRGPRGEGGVQKVPQGSMLELV